MTHKTMTSSTVNTYTTLREIFSSASTSTSTAQLTALVIPQTTGAISLAFAELEKHILHLCGCLASIGIKSKDTVAISLPNGLEFISAFLAIGWLGAVAAPLNPTYTTEENLFYLSDAKAKVVIVGPQSDKVIRGAAKKSNSSIVELQWNSSTKSLQLNRPQESQSIRPISCSASPSPNDVALLLHTSGTTSRPKAVPLTHLNLCTSIGNISRTYSLKSTDRTLLVMPLFHVHGLIGALLSTFGSRGSAVVPSKFSASAHWKLFDEYKCTWYSAVPTIHQILLKHEQEKAGSGKIQPQKHTTLRFIRSCSSALAPATFHQLEEIYGVPVIEAYAMTEAAHQMTSNELPPGKRKAGSVGRGQGVEVAALDDEGRPLPVGKEGEISVRGKNITPGYLNNPEANKSCFTSDNWFRTGDRGYLDEEGYVFLTGRLKELINRGGEKISPLEIDSILLECPIVAEAISFGVDDKVYGQEVECAVVLRRPVSSDAERAAAIQTIQNHCRTRVAAFKIPKRVYITTSVPRTATGKIQRRHVASAFASKKSKL